MYGVLQLQQQGPQQIPAIAPSHHTYRYEYRVCLVKLATEAAVVALCNGPWSLKHKRNTKAFTTAIFVPAVGRLVVARSPRLSPPPRYIGCRQLNLTAVVALGLLFLVFSNTTPHTHARTLFRL